MMERRVSRQNYLALG